MSKAQNPPNLTHNYWRVWVRRGFVQALGGETGAKETTVETEA